MLYIIIRILRWIWQDILLPHVILGMAALVTDAVEAWREMWQTLYVLFFFFRGRSHRKFPLPRSALATYKRSATEKRCNPIRNDTKGKVLSIGSSDLGAAYEETDPLTTVDDRRELSNSTRHFCAFDRVNTMHSSVETTKDTSETNAMQEVGLSTGSCSSVGKGYRCEVGKRAILIQRRILFGGKGEHQIYLKEVPGSILVPFDFSLNYSKTLHTLVSCVVGPIQQPSVSTLPTRHPAPQWPPHYVRNYGGANLPINTIGMMLPMSSSGLDDCHLERQGDTNSSAADGCTSSSAAWGHSQEFRQASNVVYRRVSSRKLDFHPSRTSPAHPIASITSHHVLSYQATRQKVLVVDLDETLCHVSTTTANMLGPPTFSEVIPTASGAELFHVWVRPYARIFLTTMAKLFNIVLFTSASKPYADTILNRIDLDHVIKKRYYRQNCRIFSRGMLSKTLSELRYGTTTRPSTFDNSTSHRSTYISGSSRDRLASSFTVGTFPDLPANAESDVTKNKLKQGFDENSKVLVKDLRILKVPFELLLQIDNSEECTLLNRDNALIIMPYIPSMEFQAAARNARNKCSSNDFTLDRVQPFGRTPGCGDPEEDEVLLSLITFLEALLVVPDVRSVLRHGRVF